jgi:serine/threonine protein kinase
MSPERRLASCPQCGDSLDVTDIPFDFAVKCDSCGAVFRQVDPARSDSPPPAEELIVQDERALAPDTVALAKVYHDPAIEAEVSIRNLPEEPEKENIIRTATCPHCQTLVQVTGLNPLEEGICPVCDKKFQVLREFGPFIIEQRLDVGGLAVVYRALDTRNKEKVALKVLSAQALYEPGARGSFKREYALTRNLRHPNLIQIFEYGEFQGFDYLVLELAEGMNLFRIMNLLPPVKPRKGTNIPENDFQMNLIVISELVCLEVALQAAAGLGAAHEHGLVHGDLKPANIMLTKDGEVKILDFGLVQFANVEQLFAESEQDHIFGTAFYIPPERVRGEKEDFRSDLYSLAATLFHMMSGRAPFYAKTLEQIALMHVQDSLTSFRGKPVVRFSVNSPNISEYTVHMIEKALKKEPRERYMSHMEFIADITLARNQLLQSMGRRPQKDGRPVLRKFIRSVPGYGLFSSFWNQVKVIVNHATSAITVSITKRMALKR